MQALRESPRCVESPRRIVGARCLTPFLGANGSGNASNGMALI